MQPGTRHSILRWIHILFGLPLLGYVYGPPEEVAQYAPVFRFVFVPVLLISGLWMWQGRRVARLFSPKPD